MQYEIKLPSDYEMEKIRKRVQLNGFKTDRLWYYCYLLYYNTLKKYSI